MKTSSLFVVGLAVAILSIAPANAEKKNKGHLPNAAGSASCSGNRRHLPSWRKCAWSIRVFAAANRMRIPFMHLQTPIRRMRLRTDFLAEDGAKEKLQGDLQEMQTLVKQGLALARGDTTTSPSIFARPTCTSLSIVSSVTIPMPEAVCALSDNAG